MSVTITDDGSRRVVEIHGDQRGFGGSVNYSRTETSTSKAALEAMLGVRGEMWLRDEIARVDAAGYVQEPMRAQIEAYVPIKGMRILDFGAGCGASTLCLAQLGAASVVGVEPNQKYVEAAEVRIRDSAFAERVDVHYLADTRRLPFADGEFNAVIMNAVLEHIPPALRQEHLKEIWRVLAPGGHLFIGETPNRIWPQDFHTTGLWLVPYMPLPLARRYAILRRRAAPDATVASLLADGIRGGSYWEVMAALRPSVHCLNVARPDDLDSFWANRLSRPGQNPVLLAVKRRLHDLHRWVEVRVLRPLGIPAVAFLAELNLCLKKADVRA